MSISANINRTEPEPVDYPCLMESNNGLIVLFTKPKHGIVLNGNANYSAGEVNEKFGMIFFETFKGELTLKNK